MLLEQNHIIFSKSLSFSDWQVHWDVCGSMDQAHSAILITVWKGWEGLGNMYHKEGFSRKVEHLWLQNNMDTPKNLLMSERASRIFCLNTTVRDVVVFMWSNSYVRRFLDGMARRHDFVDGKTIHFVASYINHHWCIPRPDGFITLSVSRWRILVICNSPES